MPGNFQAPFTPPGPVYILTFWCDYVQVQTRTSRGCVGYSSQLCYLIISKSRTGLLVEVSDLLKLGSTPSHVRRTPGELAVESSYVHHVMYTRRLSSAAYDVLLFASNGTLGGVLIFPKWLKNDNIWINFTDNNKSAMNMYLVFVYFAVNLLLGYEADGESEFYPGRLESDSPPLYHIIH
uniref:Uncharacterized protein n=1 Tax=Timema genevievae TaxID=629358 RepID=A0A7R9PGG3_TIMGE|nr:unnamed protein product [Timema genevievae]